jgi:hypothetical protein
VHRIDNYDCAPRGGWRKLAAFTARGQCRASPSALAVKNGMPVMPDKCARRKVHGPNPLERTAYRGYDTRMFNGEQIREMLTAKDFKPFRICMSDGHTYDISNHDMALVSKNAVDIGLNPDPKGVAERFLRCALIHITRIEELQAA